MTAIAAALIVASSDYEDADLSQLRAPAQDAERLAEVLADASIGGFDVKTLLNQPSHVLNLAIEDFFADRGRDDLLLLYVSCHGVKDDDGRLYFAAHNTRLPRLGATAVAAAFVNEQMTRSMSRRIVLLLDCCYSGAFPRGFLARGDKRVDIKERFDGRGRAVLTASSAMEYSFEGDQVSGEGKRSVFTGALVEGLETGLADLDMDGRVSVDELYDYVFTRVRDQTPNQTPSKWITDVQGKLYIAKAVPRELPAELKRSTESRSPDKRAAAVAELARLLAAGPDAHSAAARQALERLADDDSRRVSTAATAALSGFEEPPAPPASGPGRTLTWRAIRFPALAAAALALVGLGALGLAVTGGGGEPRQIGNAAGPTTTRASSVVTSTVASSASPTPPPPTTTTQPPPPQLVGDKNLTSSERRLLASIPSFFGGGGTCHRVNPRDDPRNIVPDEAAANLECGYAGGTTVVYSMFQTDQIMRGFFEQRLPARHLTSGQGQFGPVPGWQLNHCDDPDRGAGRVYGAISTEREQDAVRSEIGWIRDGFQTYGYAFRPSAGFADLFTWWRGVYGPVDTHRC